MNIAFVPYHDWRKILKEGFRTRDSHIIESLMSNNNISNIIIINRPYTLIELIIKRKFTKIKGEIIFKTFNGKIIQYNNNVFILDYQFFDYHNLLTDSRIWCIEKYSHKNFLQFIEKSLQFLNIKTKPELINFNILASGVNSKSIFNKIIFDAWDNFEKFPHLNKINKQITDCYDLHKKTADTWTTNSKNNVNYFSNKFKIKNITLIPNGVNTELFKAKKSYSNNYFKNIKNPIIGFGGKFTHLIDTNLVNFIIKNNPHLSFVFAGQILDKKIFNSINKTSNFYYLGDLNYIEYIGIVNNFDICILPYVVNEKDTGANSIKIYEYLAANKQIVATLGNGTEEFEEFIYLSNNFEEFSKNINLAIKSQKLNISDEILNNYSWNNLSNNFLKLLSK